jgi:DNA topoisomerase-1
MGKSLIIVESPAKTRTIRQFVGKEYELAASLGHVRDLPKRALGVDPEHDFQPCYEVIQERRTTLKKLQEAVAEAETVYIATDPDREGEAIAWHLAQALKLRSPRRIEFNEITRRAVAEALQHPREIDEKRVNAQQARRVLDRLVGYTLSPLLQKKMRKRNLSAGRVQSVAVRLICEREREIEAFVPEEYWDITALVTAGTPEDAFAVKLLERDGEKLRVGTFEEAGPIAAELWEAPLQVTRVRERDQSRRPPAPFTTSTLQQDAANRLGMSARQAMRVAQALYEGVEIPGEGHVGLITYMRTDSTRVAEEAQAAARRVIAERYGTEYVPPSPRQFPSRRGAQEAHEAIRPTSPERYPEEVAALLTDRDQVRLYELIWNRFMASQMADLRLRVKNVDVTAGRYLLRGVGVKVLFPGFTLVYPTRDAEHLIPEVAEGAWLDLVALSAEQKFTQPPPRYSEATLVRALEANGIGRPSTYAPIIGTIQDRGYVYLDEKHFHPTPLGFTVTDQLVAHFPALINVEFTADMESKLDQIEEGEADWVEILRQFYGPFKTSLDKAQTEMGYVRVQPLATAEACDLCGKPMVLQVGSKGPFLACSGYPECKSTKPVRAEEKARRARRVPPEPTDQVCEKCGSAMVIRTGRRGRFLACSAYPKCRNTRPLPEDEAALAEAAAKERCDLCGRPMVARRGRWGYFLGCTGYPECKGLKRLPTSKDASAPGEDAGGEES